jgi:biopolymer transport protein ExbD
VIEFEEFDNSINRNSGPDLTPLIDMVFLLLIFFLLTSYLARPSIPVTLPEAEKAEFSKAQEVCITIKKEGSLLLNGDIVLADELLISLNRIYTINESIEIIIQSDKEAFFGRIIEVMDISKRAGAKSISFLVEKKR